MTKTLIRGADCLTLDAAETLIEGADILIEGDRITHVGPQGSASAEGAALIEAAGMVAMPGLANTHTHSYSALLKGSVERMPLDVFMAAVILGTGARTVDDVAVAAKLSALEMLSTGTTRCLDHFSHRPTLSVEAVEAAAKGYAAAGVKATIAPMFSDRPFRDTLPLSPADMDEALAAKLPGAKAPIEPYFEMMEAALALDVPGITIIAGVDSPQRCSPALLERAGAFCAAHGIGNHTHLLEAKTQWAMGAGESLVRRLIDVGLGGPGSSFAHFIWFDLDDLSALAEAGATVVHNPASNLALGSGIQPLTALMGQGIPVAFGSDGLNTGHLGMFEKVRLAGLLPRVSTTHPREWPRPHTILQMATVNGAAACGHPGDSGQIVAGQAADIVLLDGNSFALAPRGDLASQLLLNETGASVRHVFVGGACVWRDGASTRLDAAAVVEEAKVAAARIARDTAGARDVVDAFAPGLSKMVQRVLEDGCGPCRIATLA
ncbi:MAG: amidohydrolase family protein [Pseudomonadota bacterium]